MKTRFTCAITATRLCDPESPPSGRALASAFAAFVSRVTGPCLVAAALVACAQSQMSSSPAESQPAVPVAAAAAAPPLPPILPFDQAVANAANTVFGAAPQGDHAVVIDPLVDGVTGYVSTATDGIQARVTDLVRQRYPRFSIEKFSPETLAASPLVLVGTFTAVNGKNQTTGMREAYRFCLVLGDLSTGKIVAKGVARAQLAGVDTTPTAIFSDSPAWTTDPSTQAYIATCQATKVGDPISKEFLDGLVGASLLTQADQAYNGGRYRDALNLYGAASETPAGDQLRVYNGLYLANLKLNRTNDATNAFGKVVDYGFRHNQLAVKFLFEPGSTRFYQDPKISGQYDVWLRQIAAQAAKSTSCIEVSGHTSATGSAALNERLSFLRADYVKSRLERDSATLSNRLVTNGMGSAAPLVGTGKDDLSDALDRRVELKPISNCTQS